MKPTANFSFTFTVIIFGQFFFCVCSALSDERTGLSFTRTSATGPCQRCHSWVQVPQNLRSYLTVSFETKFPFCRLLRFAELRRSYSSIPPYGVGLSSKPSQSYLTTYRQSASLSWCQTTIWDQKLLFLSLHGNYLQIFAFLWYGAHSVTIGRVRNLLVQVLLRLGRAVNLGFK
jgi:hypothetical protein